MENEAKKYLNKYKNALADIDNLDRQIERLRTEAESITAKLTETCVQTSGNADRVGDIASKIADMTIDSMEKRNVALDKMNEVMDVINSIDNADYKRLLFLRYIDGRTWEQIAVEMNYSFRWILTLHGRALIDIEKAMPDNKA